MGAPDVMHDIKVIFFIINTIVGSLGGLLLISFGVSFAVVNHTDIVLSYLVGITIAYIIVGLILLGVATLGYAGAIRQNRTMLFVYSGVMSLAAVGDIWQMTQIDGLISLLAFSITHLGLVLLAIILAVFLAVKAQNQSNQGMVLSPPPAAYTPMA